MSTTYATQVSREAPEIEAYKVGLLEEARRLYAQPMALPAVEAAGLSLGQQQAADLARQGIGAYEPYLQAGSQAITQGMGLAQQGAQTLGGITVQPEYGRARDVLQYGIASLGGAASKFRPSDITPFIEQGSPYYQNVIDEATRQINRQGDIARTQAAAQAVKAGAFGGTREGVQRAELDRALAEQKNAAIVNALQTGYGQAAQLAQGAFENQQNRQLQQASMYGQLGQGIGGLAGQEAGIEMQRGTSLGQLGQGIGQLGVQQGAIGQTLQGLGGADVGLMANIGAMEQQNAQAQLDAIRATQTQEAMLPFQQLGFVSDIYRGAPTTQMALTSQTAPSASPLQSAIGLGIAGLGAAAGAQKVGLFG
jgi:hypothetical protein